MAYSARQAPVVAPDKGSFPLDHEGQCKPFMTKLMQCLKENQGETLPCRTVSIEYLECRMEKGLMAQEPLTQLGFEGAVPTKPNEKSISSEEAKPKEKTGFVSGMEVKPVVRKKDE